MKLLEEIQDHVQMNCRVDPRSKCLNKMWVCISKLIPQLANHFTIHNSKMHFTCTWSSKNQNIIMIFFFAKFRHLFDENSFYIIVRGRTHQF